MMMVTGYFGILVSIIVISMLFRERKKERKIEKNKSTEIFTEKSRGMTLVVIVMLFTYHCLIIRKHI